MRPVILAGAACALALVTSAQAQNAPSAMPGQIVSGFQPLQPFPAVGQQAPRVGPPAGQSIGTGGLMTRPYDPSRPYDQFFGTGITPDSLTAPLLGPDGKPMSEPTYFEKLVAKVKSFFYTPVTPPAPNYTPGLSRRNRERHKIQWRLD